MPPQGATRHFMVARKEDDHSNKPTFLQMHIVVNVCEARSVRNCVEPPTALAKLQSFKAKSTPIISADDRQARSSAPGNATWPCFTGLSP